jgi:Icc-related predicted phosphoesterase
MPGVSWPGDQDALSPPNTAALARRSAFLHVKLRAMRSHALSAAAALTLLGCREQPTAPAPLPIQPLPAPQTTPQRPDLACEAPIDAPASRAKLRAPAGQLKLGVLAGLKDADDENVAYLKRLVAELRRHGAEILLADGDLGDNSDEQETLLSVLTETGLPVIAVAGNREERSELDAAEAELRKKGAKILDLSHDRIVELGDATLVGLPGAFERRQLHSDGSCLYGQREVDAVADVLPRLPQPTILVAAVPPRGSDAKALDVSEGQNVGDPRLAALLKKATFGIFGQVWESGGRAIDGANQPVAPGAEVEHLYLNPGAADHTPWPMSDGSTSNGQAALLTVRGRKASWEKIVVAEPASPPDAGVATDAGAAR